MPALQPNTEQMTRFAKDAHDGPIVMINLLKFKDKAEYKEGDPEAKEALTGEEAYNRYGDGLVELGKDPEIGVNPIYTGSGHGYLIGGGEEWDRVLVVHHPSRHHMLRMMRDPRYQKAHRNREAGLKYQELIETHPMDQA